MASKTDICNMAILSLGGNPVNEVGVDSSRESTLCDQFWDIRLSEILSAHKWNFAKVWVALPEDSDYDAVDEEYSYAYTLPSDYVRMSRMEDVKSEFQIRANILLTNVEDAIIEYIALITDTEKFPAWFISAIVGRLKADLSVPLARRGTKTVDYLNIYYTVDLPRAKLRDAEEGFPSEEAIHRHTDANDTWLSSRG